MRGRPLMYDFEKIPLGESYFYENGNVASGKIRAWLLAKKKIYIAILEKDNGFVATHLGYDTRAQKMKVEKRKLDFIEKPQEKTSVPSGFWNDVVVQCVQTNQAVVLQRSERSSFSLAAKRLGLKSKSGSMGNGKIAAWIVSNDAKTTEI